MIINSHNPAAALDDAMQLVQFKMSLMIMHH